MEQHKSKAGRRSQAKDGADYVIVKTDEQLYQVIMNCAPQYCKEVRHYMKRQGYKITVSKNHALGDHYGVRRFETYTKAKRAVRALLRKYDAERMCKVRSITLNPYVGLVKVKV